MNRPLHPPARCAPVIVSGFGATVVGTLVNVCSALVEDPDRALTLQFLSLGAWLVGWVVAAVGVVLAAAAVDRAARALHPIQEALADPDAHERDRRVAELLT